MSLVFPLRLRRFESAPGQTCAFIITDARGRSLQIPCEQADLRREVAKLFSPAEAEAIAKWIARRLTDEWAVQIRVHQNGTPVDRKR